MNKDRVLDELSVLQERFSSGMGWQDGEYADALDEAIELINNMPSADVVEVKHGEWVKTNPLTDTVECSLCHYQIISEELITPFCPWCGADMRGETK